MRAHLHLILESSRRGCPLRQTRRRRPVLESLEGRTLLSGNRALPTHHSEAAAILSSPAMFLHKTDLSAPHHAGSANHLSHYSAQPVALGAVLRTNLRHAVA
jgi:hypothetical protein